MCIIGLDIGGTKTAVVLGDREGRIHDRVQFPTAPERVFPATFDILCQHVETIRARAREHEAVPRMISVSIGGPLDIERGIIYSPPNLPGWDAVPLKQLLEDRFGLPVYVEHDGNAGALAEWYFGAARGARNVVFLTMGTGLGGGLILNGQLYRGTSDLAGEVGHIRIAEKGPVAYGKAGSWEAFCSGAGIARLAALRFPERWGGQEVTVRDLAELAALDDADALAVFAEAGRYLGRGLAVLLDILNPEVIVIGSLAVRLGEWVLGPAREEMRREALPGAVEACRVVPAALGERIGDVASLCAAIAAVGGPSEPDEAHL
ncbi:MAG: ROK family protein [Anaerolineae bacterium]|nr:ROK family protein [Anaerolineae bacterium]